MPHNESGFTLIEVLISVLLSVIIIAAIVDFMLSLSAEQQQLQARFNQQQTQHFLAHYLSHEIHDAGFVGCASATLADSCLQGSVRINPSDESYLLKQRAPGSDLLQINKMRQPSMLLEQSVNQNRQLIVKGVDPSFKKNKQVIIADCYHCTIATIEKVSVSKVKQQMRLWLNKTINFPDIEATSIAVKQQINWYLKSKDAHNSLYERQGKRSEELLPNINRFNVSLIKPDLLKVDYAMPDKLRAVDKKFTILIALREFLHG